MSATCSTDRSQPGQRSLPVRLAARALLAGLAPRVDRRIIESSRPFARPEMLRPHQDSSLWAWTHYGIFLPRLPGRHRYLNTMTLIGATGSVCFDNDYLAVTDARHTSTVFSSTAHAAQRHYRAYDTRTECEFAADGSALRWGDDLEINGSYPHFTMTGRYPGFRVDAEITATPQVSWFIRTPVYDHFSLLATCRGTLTDAEGSTDIDTLCTVEYARCLSPQALTARPVPESLKVPVDFFTYQIINLDQRTQLLLTDVRAAGTTACRMAHLRSLDGDARAFTDVRMEVLSDRPAVDELGRVMRVPRELRWSVRDGRREVFALTVAVDSPLRYGHGRGYAGAMTYAGSWRGRAIDGSGYMEWVDCERR
ncbi:DUF6670 family protein [Nocardia cyriacigeorgica]|uniref:DUF6670 family protein n=1 Tax=Nocardia cyriacigeorgica TaxID=135487 RepID=UPI001E53FB40|nr:DUF6670 family protein [Nocardia cyriacigeorgica]